MFSFQCLLKLTHHYWYANAKMLAKERLESCAISTQFKKQIIYSKIQKTCYASS